MMGARWEKGFSSPPHRAGSYPWKGCAQPVGPFFLVEEDGQEKVLRKGGVVLVPQLLPDQGQNLIQLRTAPVFKMGKGTRSAAVLHKVGQKERQRVVLPRALPVKDGVAALALAVFVPEVKAGVIRRQILPDGFVRIPPGEGMGN